MKRAISELIPYSVNESRGRLPTAMFVSLTHAKNVMTAEKLADQLERSAGICPAYA